MLPADPPSPNKFADRNVISCAGQFLLKSLTPLRTSGLWQYRLLDFASQWNLVWLYAIYLDGAARRIRESS
eukprot:scaffold583688_cov13-Prasinocladus_malaysianus.AAC.1